MHEVGKLVRFFKSTQIYRIELITKIIISRVENFFHFCALSMVNLSIAVPSIHFFTNFYS